MQLIIKRGSCCNRATFCNAGSIPGLRYKNYTCRHSLACTSMKDQPLVELLLLTLLTSGYHLKSGGLCLVIRTFRGWNGDFDMLKLTTHSAHCAPRNGDFDMLKLTMHSAHCAPTCVLKLLS